MRPLEKALQEALTHLRLTVTHTSEGISGTLQLDPTVTSPQEQDVSVRFALLKNAVEEWEANGITEIRPLDNIKTSLFISQGHPRHLHESAWKLEVLNSAKRIQLGLLRSIVPEGFHKKENYDQYSPDDFVSVTIPLWLPERFFAVPSVQFSIEAVDATDSRLSPGEYHYFAEVRGFGAELVEIFRIGSVHIKEGQGAQITTGPAALGPILTIFRSTCNGSSDAKGARYLTKIPLPKEGTQYLDLNRDISNLLSRR